MRIFPWLGLSWLMVIGVAALWSRMGGLAAPSGALIVIAFLATRADLTALIVCAVGAGYLTGLQSGAPIGIYEMVMVVVALVQYRFGGDIAGEGVAPFALAVLLLHILQDALLWLIMSLCAEALPFAVALGRMGVGTLLSGVLSLFMFPLMNRFSDQWSRNRFDEGLTWD